MLESLFLTLALCQQPQKNVRPEFTPNPPKKVERPTMTLDIYIDMIRRGDRRADLNKDGQIDGKDLEILLERKMRFAQQENPRRQRPHRRGGNRQNGKFCNCKSK